MPYTVEWLVEGRVVNVKLVGELTIDDYVAVSNEIKPFIEAGTAALTHVLIDSTEHITNTTNAPRVPELLKAGGQFMRDPKMGWLIVFGNTSTFIKLTVSVVAQITRARHRIVSDRGSAIQFLQGIDSTLPQMT